MEAIDTKIVISLIAAFVSFIGLLISKEQKTSEFRQAWINLLRDEISRFIGEVNSIEKLVLINKATQKEYREETSSKVITESVKFREIQSKVQLLINPKEEKHRELVQIMANMVDNLKNRKNNDASVQSLTNKSQEILKEEWVRVKQGEPVFKFSKWFVGLVSLGLLLYFLYQGFGS